ncbi:dihydrodipicolinate synthase family protein [candidate division KSB1 bacterium]|nr:dihydrodipicolinate synthase family protein [candidate division KSB1 bacterium]
MKNKKTYHGVVIPMLTPFKQDGTLDEDAAVKLVDHILEAGTLPFILGTTGESASIPFEMRIRLVKLVTDHVKSESVVFAGISDNCIDNSLYLAGTFYDLGIKAFVAHLPSYYPLTADMMLAHFEKLAERCPGDILIYNIKSTTHMTIPIEVIEKLSRHEKIVGLKDSDRDLERLQTLTNLFAGRADFSLFCGWTTQSAATLLMGFDGIVPSTGNLIPAKFSRMYDAVMRGDQQTAQQWQAEVNPIAEAHQAGLLGSQAIVALKVMMDEAGLCGPNVLPPLTRLSSEREKQLRDAVKQLQ